MPKIIENLRERLLSKAKKQLIEEGYSAVTVRSVAAACGIGTGTFYNYFRSKDILIAVIMLEDWQSCLDAVNACVECGCGAEELMLCIFTELRGYADAHSALFADPQAKKIFSAEMANYHGRLRGQLAEQLLVFCRRGEYENAEFLGEFIAEALITWTIAGKDFNDISGILLKLL